MKRCSNRPSKLVSFHEVHTENILVLRDFAASDAMEKFSIEKVWKTAPSTHIHPQKRGAAANTVLQDIAQYIKKEVGC